MANAPFTRDEAILALDTLLFSNNSDLNANSKEIIELSDLLNQLPIVSRLYRDRSFRNYTGVSQQLALFTTSMKKNTKNPHVGAIFYTVFNEYQNNLEELHKIALAIKRNLSFFENASFGNIDENHGFPEGALMCHLHTLLESRQQILNEQKCEICQLNLADIYVPSSTSFFQSHLLIPLNELDSSKKYKSTDYITVCPNCHAILHAYRPWLSRENITKILL